MHYCLAHYQKRIARITGILVMSGMAAVIIWGCTIKTTTLTTTENIITSAAGDKLAQQDNISFTTGTASGNVLRIYPDNRKQTIDGIGTSFTESSAFVLAHLHPDNRAEVMQQIYGASGADFTLARTHIGACDFSVKGRYSYADFPDDTELSHFSIAPDAQGFDPAEFPGIQDASYDLLPMIKEALAIKQKQDEKLRIVASAWTAPSWMKDINDWYIPGGPHNNWQGTGGSLKPHYEATYADYLLRYLQAYQKEGIPIWGITPVNEPHGNNGQWESMHFSPESQNDFIKKYLGPRLKNSTFSATKLLIYDQNRDGLEHWANVIFADLQTTPYLYGAAIHWYESTYKVYEDVLDRVHAAYPDFALMHTEGCIDDLGKDAPNGVLDPEKFKEENWFDNDDFWWHDNATDWAYSVTWQGVNADDHPAYTPVHRYARNIIVSLDHWVTGWIDWNIVLDSNGGPNHVGNFCGAPIMIDTASKQVYYTPIFYVLSQFSRTIRPGDQAVQTSKHTPDLGNDDLHACATINADNLLSVQVLNTTVTPLEYQLQIGEQYARVTIPANALQTLRIPLPEAR